MKIGIVGLPNVGKSTLFNAITKSKAPAENYPFCTIDPNVGVVTVPDDRIDRLAEMEKSEKRVPAIVEFVDIAGLVKGASKGEGLGNKFLSHIREVDAIAMVVLKSQRRILRSQDSEGGLAETTGGLGPPLRSWSNSFRAEAQRFKCRATMRRSRAVSRSSR